MKYLELRGTPDPSAVPDLFTLIADAPFVTETRLVDWNLGETERPTLLFSVTGSTAPFRDAIGKTDSAVEWDITTIDDERFYCYLRTDPPPLFESLLDAITTAGLVVVKPVVYRNGAVRARLVGDPGVLQAVLAGIPSVVDLDIQAIGEYAGGETDPVGALSDRQREAIEVALELGYFEQPRAVTHEDVAEQMGCASSTASEHLQKGIETLVETVFENRYRSDTSV